jgi:hypothetical protein
MKTRESQKTNAIRLIIKTLPSSLSDDDDEDKQSSWRSGALGPSLGCFFVGDMPERAEGRLLRLR